MLVFKFGGASVKNAEAVKNVASIIRKYENNSSVIVVSAMGKTTNAMELLINSYCYAKSEVKHALATIVDYHNEILWDLFSNKSNQVYVAVNELFSQIEDLLEKDYCGEFDKTYDQFIGYGELISTTIISFYLKETGLSNKWLDARSIIKTNNTFRSAEVNWENTSNLIKEACKSDTIFVTQGFISSNSLNETTSLGREGSDFTGAIFAYCLDADSLTIWKDVPGMLNADPRYYPNAKKLAKISYKEAIELSYYGASVIHPKTIKPLQNKNIPLYIDSFLNPDERGTVIQASSEFDTVLPSYIFTKNQVLLSISPRDFSFIAEGSISHIFKLIAQQGIKVNLMQNSALNFSVCVPNDERKVKVLIDELNKDFKVFYNEDITLFTIRHYNQQTIDNVIGDQKILLEQRTRHTARFALMTK